MADRRFELKVENNLKEIKGLLGSIQKSLSAINKIKKENNDLDKEKIQIQRNINKNFDAQIKKINEAYKAQMKLLDAEKELANLKAKAQGYNDFADNVRKKFSFDNLRSAFNADARRRISGKFESQHFDAKAASAESINRLNVREQREISKLASKTIHHDTYEKEVAKIRERYKGLKDNANAKLEKNLSSIGADEQQALAEQDLKNAKGNAVAAIVQKTIQMVSSIAKTINNLSNKILGISLSIKDAWGDILDRTSKMVTEMATFATGSSLITNSQARTTQMKYGLSDAQTYAFTQTKALLKIDGDEDLMYMNASQRQVFTEYMQKYSGWYEQLMSSGALQDIQKMQLEFAMFKQEVAVELLQFVADNKDTLLAAAKGIMSILEWVMKIGTNLLGGIFGSGNSSTSNTANNVTIKVDYVDGGSGGSQMGSFVSDLSRQISTALGG